MARPAAAADPARRLPRSDPICPAHEQQPQEDFASLYRRAFVEYGARALWNKRALDVPTPEDALVVARALRIEGNHEARRLAERIERACRAAV